MTSTEVRRPAKMENRGGLGIQSSVSLTERAAAETPDIINPQANHAAVSHRLEVVSERAQLVLLGLSGSEIQFMRESAGKAQGRQLALRPDNARIVVADRAAAALDLSSEGMVGVHTDHLPGVGGVVDYAAGRAPADPFIRSAGRSGFHGRFLGAHVRSHRRSDHGSDLSEVQSQRTQGLHVRPSRSDGRPVKDAGRGAHGSRSVGARSRPPAGGRADCQADSEIGEKARRDAA